VHQPLKRMGARAVELLVSQVRKTQERGERHEEIIPHQLMRRDSTAAVQ
jgi:DNA-binding LacI/PurR family transcriptional regulator